MNETLKLIDQLIAEHKVMNERAMNIEKAANDASLLTDLKEARETFVPGRFDQRQSLGKLEEMLVAIGSWLDKHFNREETILLSAVEKHGERKLISALNSLLLEHTDIRNRIGESKEHIAELTGGGLGRHRWDASANDMRAHLTHTRRLLEAHAAMENGLFAELRRALAGDR
ncbi:MAG: hemerythrin domain-containing protein [Chloroflexota bacterium]